MLLGFPNGSSTGLLAGLLVGMLACSCEAETSTYLGKLGRAWFNSSGRLLHSNNRGECADPTYLKQ